MGENRKILTEQVLQTLILYGFQGILSFFEKNKKIAKKSVDKW